jgi:hypothetical protein
MRYHEFGRLLEAPQFAAEVKGIHVYEMRSRADLMWLIKNSIRGTVRALLTPEDDILAWDGYEAIHHTVATGLRGAVPGIEAAPFLSFTPRGVSCLDADAVLQSPAIHRVYGHDIPLGRSVYHLDVETRG